jgi:hypothetical protein
MELRFIVRIVVMTAAFAGLAACSIPSPGEYVRVEGEVAQLGGGSIKGCGLRVYDDGTGELIHEAVVGNTFTVMFVPGGRPASPGSRGGAHPRSCRKTLNRWPGGQQFRRPGQARVTT